MLDIVIYILACFGVAAVMASIYCFARDVKDAISFRIAKKKWENAYMHRFDKPPVAKCYCNDCTHFSSFARGCAIDNRHVNDNDFCSMAKPRKMNGENSS